RHRVAVEGGRYRPRFARYVEQYRRDRAAEQRAPVNAGQHDDRRGRRHRERERQQDRDAIGTPETRQHAYDDAQHDAKDHQRQIEWLSDDREAVKEIADVLEHGPRLVIYVTPYRGSRVPSTAGLI